MRCIFQRAQCRQPVVDVTRAQVLSAGMQVRFNPVTRCGRVSDAVGAQCFV